MLPPQNATGNWVKVVQRIPLRASVNCREGDPPLARRHERDDRDRHRPQRTFGDILEHRALIWELGPSRAHALAPQTERH